MALIFTFFIATIYFFIFLISDINRDENVIKVFQSFTCFTHGTLVSISSYIDIIMMIIQGSNFEDKSFLNNWHYFSLFYFIYDTYLCIYLKQYMYIGHHICVIIAIIYTTLSDKNYNLLSVILLSGEITAPLFNGMKLLKIFGFKTQLLFIIFTSLFCLIRFVLIPILIIFIAFNTQSYDIYIFVPIGIILIYGSFIWAKGQYRYIKTKISHKLD